MALILCTTYIHHSIYTRIMIYIACVLILWFIYAYHRQAMIFMSIE